MISSKRYRFYSVSGMSLGDSAPVDPVGMVQDIDFEMLHRS